MSGLYAVLFQLRCLHGAVNRPATLLAAGNLQSRLCEAISRIKRSATKSTRPKLAYKQFHRSGMNRFSSVVSNLPTAQIELFALFCRYLGGTQVISKIRP